MVNFYENNYIPLILSIYQIVKKKIVVIEKLIKLLFFIFKNFKSHCLVGENDFLGFGLERPGAVGLAHQNGAHKRSTSALQCACANKRATHVGHITDHVVGSCLKCLCWMWLIGLKCVGPSDWIIKLLTDWRVRLLVAHQNHLIFQKSLWLFLEPVVFVQRHGWLFHLGY